MLMLIPLILLVLPPSKAQSTTEPTLLLPSAATTINITATLTPNGTITKPSNINMIAIVQPSQSLDHRFISLTPKASNVTAVKFKPSPQIDSYLEFSRFPIVPETNQHQNEKFVNLRSTAGYEVHSSYVAESPTKPSRSGPPSEFNLQPTFPSSFKSPNYLPSNYDPKLPEPKTTTKKPLRSNGAEEKQLHFPPSRPEGYEPSSFQEPMFNWNWWNDNRVGFPTKQTFTSGEQIYPHKFSSGEQLYSKPTFTSAEHPYPFVMSNSQPDEKPPKSHNYLPTFSDSKKPSHGLKETSGEEYLLEHPRYKMMAPWKKAAKLFAAILPIGLLISALTPSILTIKTMNHTNGQYCRKDGSRASDEVNPIDFQKWSGPGCEARLLCETAIRRDERDLETIKKLFWKFVSKNAEEKSTANELEAVSKAIQSKKCDKIICKPKSVGNELKDG